MGSGLINPKAWAAAPVGGRRPPIIEQLAAELQGTGGTISKQAHGALYRGGAGLTLVDPWDMAREWRGKELSNYSFRDSNWSKTIVVSFYVEPPGIAGRIPAFILHLVPPLTDAEIAQMAETYMMVLNMRRVT